MKPNSPIVHALLFLALCAVACSPRLAPEDHYQNTPVVADGSTADWQIPLRFSNEKYTLQYNVTSDRQFLYFCLLTTDNATQRRILKEGMTLYFDPKGKKNKDISISFPVKKDDSEDNFNRYRNRNGNPIRPGNEDSLKNSWLLQSNYFDTKGFVNMEDGQYGINDKKCPIQVALKLNNDSVLVYEAIIPIHILIGTELTPKQGSRNFSLGVVLNAVISQGTGYNNSPRPSFGGMRGMGMGGGMMGGGMRGGYGGGGRNGNAQRQQGEKEEDTWYTFRFSYKG